MEREHKYTGFKSWLKLHLEILNQNKELADEYYKLQDSEQDSDAWKESVRELFSNCKVFEDVTNSLGCVFIAQYYTFDLDIIRKVITKITNERDLDLILDFVEKKDIVSGIGLEDLKKVVEDKKYLLKFYKV